jgi:hypothetical protein
MIELHPIVALKEVSQFMNYDATGIWFEAFKALGEPSDILFDFKVKNESQSVKYSYPHSKGDGTAAMAELAVRHNFKIEKSEDKNLVSSLSLLNYLKQIIMFNYHARPRKEKLWPFTLAKATTTETPYSYFVINKDELSLLKTYLHSQKVSLNTYLLQTLNLSTRQILKPIRKDLTWIIPVNFRRELALEINASGNLSANFTCDIQDETPLELQNKISRLLKSKRHWGVWFWQNTSKYMPFFLVKLLTKIRLHPNYNTGIFTNLGAWTSTTDFSHITVFANPIISHPIVASSLEMNGSVTLGLRIYPTFPLTQAELEQYLVAWKNNIFHKL